MPSNLPERNEGQAIFAADNMHATTWNLAVFEEVPNVDCLR
jgi:hypothetical protein